MPIYWQLFALVAAHFTVDYSLQSDTLARQKNPDCDNALSVDVPWYYWMTAHAIMHAGAVALITHSLWMTAFEFIGHFLIDYFKCKDWISLHTDQSMHLVMKGSYIWSMV